MVGTKKKKSFIDKKNASTYHLMHRSQRDVGGGGGDPDDAVNGQAVGANGMILWPGSSNLASTDRAVLLSSNEEESNRMVAWRDQLAKAGLLDDNEHEKYLKPMSGQGVFLSASNKASSSAAGGDVRYKISDSSMSNNNNRISEEALVEVHRQMDSIPLTADCMDEDIAAALFGDFDEEDYEELNDDFMLDAAAAEVSDDTNGKKDNAFDYDAHVQQLLEKARRDAAGGAMLDHSINAGFFANLKPLHERDDDDDEGEYCSDYNEEDNEGEYNNRNMNDGYTATVATEPGVVAKLGPEEERALCEKFEATLAEYDEEDSYNDDNNNDDNYLNNYGVLRPLEGDAVVEAALDDFLMEHEDDVYIQATETLDKNGRSGVAGGGSGFSVLVGTRMVSVKELENHCHPEQEPALPLAEYLAEADLTLAQPKQRPPTDEICFDGKASYISERERNPWDCESILSTYSNLDNNPTMVDANASSRRRRRNQKCQPVPIEPESEQPTQHIRLSAKTGLPIGVFDKPIVESNNEDLDDDDDDGFDETVFSVNRGVARCKDESSDEKKARKLLVKRERELARIQKKMTRQVYADEFQRRAVGGDDDMAGKTVFRFS